MPVLGVTETLGGGSWPSHPRGGLGVVRPPSRAKVKKKKKKKVFAHDGGSPPSQMGVAGYPMWPKWVAEPPLQFYFLFFIFYFKKEP
jgi:hypothetical protein